MKMKLFLITAVAAMAGTPAFAQAVANTSKKGSLLIFPQITIDPVSRADTFIEITNDQTTPVHVECNYINEQKGRTDFDFQLTGKATVSWDVGTLAGDGVHPPPFPTSSRYPAGGSIYNGALICFAINQSGQTQVAFNHLHGTATVTYPVASPKRGYRYNPWSFTALTTNNLPAADYTEQGTAGRLDLKGAGVGTYDACPAYTTTAFMPNGAALGNVRTINNGLGVVTCNQDLRQDALIHLTKLQFTVWNSREQSYTGAYQCIDSVKTLPLVAGSPGLVNGTNFNFTTLGTADGMFKVQAVASTVCRYSESAGLLSVLISNVGLGANAAGLDQTIGSSMHQAGAAPGYVLWDPFGGVPFSSPRRQ